MKLKNISLLTLTVLFFGILFAAGCNTRPEDGTTDGTASIKVVTSIAPLYSLSANLLEGTNAKLDNLVPPNASAHTFQLTPGSVKLLSEADVIVINGLGLEEFLEEAIANTNALVVDTSRGISALKSLEADEHEGEEDEHGEFDPHIWLSVKNAQAQAQNIALALKQKDPANSDKYDANAAVLDAKLNALHDEVKLGLESLDLAPYIVFHDAYQYFERDFDVHSIAALEPFPGKEPSASYLKELIELIEENDVKVAFSEPQFSPKLLQALSKDYNLQVFELDPLGREVSNNAYFKLLQSNLAAFSEAFPKK